LIDRSAPSAATSALHHNFGLKPRRATINGTWRDAACWKRRCGASGSARPIGARKFIVPRIPRLAAGESLRRNCFRFEGDGARDLRFSYFFTSLAVFVYIAISAPDIDWMK
jgi:hypothetical protein